MKAKKPASIRLLAVLNVIAWGGFWAFGYLALTAGEDASGQVMIALILAALGGGIGVWAYTVLIRASQMTGYEKPYKRARIEGAGDVNREQPQ